jgi:membrane-bound inhibitor of C-type lysozyme
VRALAVLPSIVAIAACQQAGAPSESRSDSSVRYVCDDGRIVTSTYLDGPDGTTALVNLGDGVAQYGLTQTVSASGVRYVGQGLDPGQRIQWWTRGLSEATLSTLAAGEEVASEPGTICRARTD